MDSRVFISADLCTRATPEASYPAHTTEISAAVAAKPEEANQLTCRACKKRFASSLKHLWHELGHRIKMVGWYRSTKCFVQKWSLVKHARNHTEEHPTAASIAS
ncbi:uncharacterized protein [Dermacentor albipictus]|uniref:uncharacterized protein n=1 Tax=Dermacentor albipictus TaxID=60249 RepID=UPI0038FC4194